VVTVLVRAGEDWIGHVVTGAIDRKLPEIGISVPLSEVYRGLEFSDAASTCNDLYQ
jgi:hypothetical protein